MCVVCAVSPCGVASLWPTGSPEPTSARERSPLACAGPQLRPLRAHLNPYRQLLRQAMPDHQTAFNGVASIPNVSAYQCPCMGCICRADRAVHSMQFTPRVVTQCGCRMNRPMARTAKPACVGGDCRAHHQAIGTHDTVSGPPTGCAWRASTDHRDGSMPCR